jgi:hypothetical protein
VIFECWKDNERIRIFDLFNSLDYAIYNLPWKPEDKAEDLKYDQFLNSLSSNYIAVPKSN